ncbi:hypothetical protein AMTR_s00052p00070330 [Amborella trichopoda]|uniref:Uncharacterized protein n=1 Tax=Amborella trichopoda TaxID=13333 RepID=U5CSY2_AMBTC|nr:hypothetical protein AMTR_s00052p00070330 [Amborella trichopoda]
MIFRANDGLVSTASLMVGIGVAMRIIDPCWSQASLELSWEHVAWRLENLSVSTQRDTEKAVSTSKFDADKLKIVHNHVQVLKSIIEDQEKQRLRVTQKQLYHCFQGCSYEARIMVLAVVSSMALVVLGGVGARLGG